MNGYTYGYIKSSILSMMDMTESEMNQNNLMNKIPYYLNRGMTEICSSVKPCYSHVSIYVNKNNINKPIDISEFTSKSFIGFAGSGEFLPAEFNRMNGIIDVDDKQEVIDYTTKPHNLYGMKETHDKEMIHMDYSTVICFKEGLYKIPVKLRWWKFATTEQDATDINCPEDILDALCLFVATELWSLEDERKGTIMRNKYEMALSRLDDTNYNNTSTFYIEEDE